MKSINVVIRAVPRSGNKRLTVRVNVDSLGVTVSTNRTATAEERAGILILFKNIVSTLESAKPAAPGGVA